MTVDERLRKIVEEKKVLEKEVRTLETFSSANGSSKYQLTRCDCNVRKGIGLVVMFAVSLNVITKVYFLNS